MGLNNFHFDAILREYEETRMHNHRIHEARLIEVYDKVDGYKELDDSTVSVAMDIAKKRLNGNNEGADELHSLLSELKSMKDSLLTGAGFPIDYLAPIYTCPDCKDTGYIDNRKCHCLEQRIVSVLYEQSNIIEYINDNNFSNLSFDYYKDADLDRFKKCVDTCHDFVENFKTENQNLLLYGSVGVGKSFLSGCIAKEVLDRGHSVIYFSSAALFQALSHATFNNESKDELYNLNDYIYNCDLLIVDDLGTELASSFVSTQLFSFLNERALRKKSTIISTNLSLEQIRDRYSDRVFSRIVSTYSVLKLSGPDIRILKKAAI